MTNFPFDEFVSGKTVKRIFYPNVDSEELIWHFDCEDRIINVVQSGGWMFQEDGKLPIKLKDNDKFLIKKNLWHRVHKGPGVLIVQIEFLE